MPMDATTYLEQKNLQNAKKIAEAVKTPSALVVGGGGGWGADATPGGYGADSVFANTPSGPEDKGTLTKFGSEGTGAVKSMNVGTPVKEEPF